MSSSPGARSLDLKIEKTMGRSPQTSYKAEASDRLTLRLEISALPRYPDNFDSQIRSSRSQ